MRILGIDLAAAAMVLAVAMAREAGAGPVKPDALPRAIAAARPGETIVMADGVWNNVTIVFKARGTSTWPITLRAQTPGKVVLTGGSKLNIAGEYVVVDGILFTGGELKSGASLVEFRRNSKDEAQHCRLTNCAIVDANPRDKATESHWVSLYGADNRVDHCYLAGKTNVGTTLVVWVNGPNRHTIDFNHFGPRVPLGENGGETIRVGTSAVSMQDSRTVVEHNYFEHCDGEVECISNKSCENVYRHNTFVNCSATLTLRHGNRCLVAGNFFLGNKTRGSGGVRVIGEGHRVVNNNFDSLAGDDTRSALSLANALPNSPLHGYLPVKNVIVAFNTFVDNRSSLALGAGADKKNTIPPSDCLIANNLIVSRSRTLIDQQAAPINLKWAGNVMYGRELGIPTAAGVLQVDPKLERAADGLTRPGEGSPAIGAATGDVPDVNDDIDGQPRGARRDVGCDQRSNRPVIEKPLTPGDVGPTLAPAGAQAPAR